MSAIDYIPGSFKTTMLPQWWGAVGDGVTDDTVAIQSAINHTPSGGDVFFPPGTYKITADLEISANVKLRGAGEFASAISQATAGQDIVTVYGQGGGVRTVIERLWLTGGRNGIYLASGFLDRVSSFRDLRFTAQTNAAIASAGAMIGCSHSNLSIEGTGLYGIYAEGDDLLGSTTWANVRIAGTTAAGVYVKQPSTGGLQPNITFLNPVIEYNYGVGLYLFSSEALLVNAHFEGNGITADAVNYASGVPDIAIDSNYPDAIGTAYGACTMVGGVFSVAGANQYVGGGGTSCRVWGKNYGTRFHEQRTFHRNDDRIDCADHLDKLRVTLLDHSGTVTVLGAITMLGYAAISAPGFATSLVGEDTKVGFFDKRSTPALLQSATDIDTLLTALRAYGLIAPAA